MSNKMIDLRVGDVDKLIESHKASILHQIADVINDEVSTYDAYLDRVAIAIAQEVITLTGVNN